METSERHRTENCCKSICEYVRWVWFMIPEQQTKSSERPLNVYYTALPSNLCLFQWYDFAAKNYAEIE